MSTDEDKASLSVSMSKWKELQENDKVKCKSLAALITSNKICLIGDCAVNTWKTLYCLKCLIGSLWIPL